jgi:hypothetical protein
MALFFEKNAGNIAKKKEGQSNDFKSSKDPLKRYLELSYIFC